MFPGHAIPTTLLLAYVSLWADGPRVWLWLAGLGLWWALGKRSPFLALALPIAALYLRLLSHV